MTKEADLYDKRGLSIRMYEHVCIKRSDAKRPIYMAKEAYLYDKRGRSIRQKRPVYTYV